MTRHNKTKTVIIAFIFTVQYIALYSVLCHALTDTLLHIIIAFCFSTGEMFLWGEILKKKLICRNLVMIISIALLLLPFKFLLILQFDFIFGVLYLISIIGGISIFYLAINP